MNVVNALLSTGLLQTLSAISLKHYMKEMSPRQEMFPLGQALATSHPLLEQSWRMRIGEDTGQSLPSPLFIFS